MRAPSNSSLYALLVIAGGARLLMQAAAMPPYAGLDELYHVARLSFVRAEGRNPTIAEKSVPRYLALIPRWPESNVVTDRPVDSVYVAPNYEAQQPSLYYSIAARLVPARSAMFELRAWRLLSVFFALIIVVGTAMIDTRGIAAAALIVSLPTWETLVVRASNDAFACAIVTTAIAATVRRKTMVEAIAWPLAIAAKLYTWPMLIVLPLFWRSQRAGRGRMIAVTSASIIGFALTIADLAHRTRNPLGLFAFDPSAVHVQSIRIGEMLKIWIATLAWTSGQHWDALKPLGIAIYGVPILVAVLLGCWVARRNSYSATEHLSNRATLAGLLSCWVARKKNSATEQLSNRATLAAVAAFAVAQIINAAAYARTATNGLPAGGKEGWYWYALVPMVVPFLLPRLRALAWWIVGWDVLITEVALFHDYSGASSPAHPTALFRWGPWHWPFTANLSNIGVGPLVGAIVLLRIIHLAAFFALQSLTHLDRPHDLALPSH